LATRAVATSATPNSTLRAPTRCATRPDLAALDNHVEPDLAVQAVTLHEIVRGMIRGRIPIEEQRDPFGGGDSRRKQHCREQQNELRGEALHVTLCEMPGGRSADTRAAALTKSTVSSSPSGQSSANHLVEPEDDAPAEPAAKNHKRANRSRRQVLSERTRKIHGSLAQRLDRIAAPTGINKQPVYHDVGRQRRSQWRYEEDIRKLERGNCTGRVSPCPNGAQCSNQSPEGLDWWRSAP